MSHYSSKTYGRNREVTEIYQAFLAGRDVSMHGPRRLGKTFVLERLVEQSSSHGFRALKVEIAGCSDTRAVFRELCHKIDNHRSRGERVKNWSLQRAGQLLEPRSDHGGPWYQSAISLDHEAYFERQVRAMDKDPKCRWALLIDELPIFLKALHDKGQDGVVAARNFMNLTSRLRADYPRVRWMITGSIGIEPLARTGAYMGVLAKYHQFELHPLTTEQAMDLVQDLAREGQLPLRRLITNAEAKALVDAVGWRAAYYLDALARKLSGEPNNDQAAAEGLVEEAAKRLLEPAESATFGTWEEHLRKHYRDADGAIAFAVLTALAQRPQGLTVDGLLSAIGRVDLTSRTLRALLTRLQLEGFVTVTGWDSDRPSAAFCHPLLRRWWLRYLPQQNS